MADLINTPKHIIEIRERKAAIHSITAYMKWKWVVRIYDHRSAQLRTIDTIHFEEHEEHEMKDYIFWALTNKESWPTIHPSWRSANITELDS